MRNKLPDFVTIGYIEKAYGNRGEVRVNPTTDYPPRFKELKTVFIEPPQGEIQKFDISSVTLRGSGVYLCFKNIYTRQEALALKGSTIKIKREECLPLEEGRFYHFELVGLKVKTMDGEYLGCVEDVWDLPANSVFVVRKEGQEFLIPAIKDVIRKIDLAEEEIIIFPLEGLLE